MTSLFPVHMTSSAFAYSLTAEMEEGEDCVLLLKSFLEDFNKKRGTEVEEDFIQFRLMNSFVPEEDFEGEITDWALQYLYQHKCPYAIAGAIVRAVVDVLKVCDLQNYYHQNGGTNKQSIMFDSSKLMQAVHTRVQETCEQWFQSGKFQFQFNPQVVSVCAVKNSRRRMEDRHVVIPDLNQFFGFQGEEPQSFYAVFDGHAGADAAIYAAAHLHQNIVHHPSFRDDIEKAMKEGFKHTDERFIAKSNREGLKSGTTVVCAIVRPKSIHVAWLGDSQAILICQGNPITVMMPHKPDRDDERERIERLGGCVVYYGTWRVNGTLAVSRAIGDAEYKPYVSGEPDISSIELSGSEDFLLLACDGMWDVLTPEDASYIIYSHLIQNKDDAEGISQKLVQTAKERGSSDNITVLVIFLKSVAEIIKGGMPISPPAQTCTISRPTFPEGIVENGESPTKIIAPDFTNVLPTTQNPAKLPEYYENTNPFMESSNPFSSPTNPFTSHEPEFKGSPFEIEQMSENVELPLEPSAPQLSPTEMTSRLITLPPEGIEDVESSPRSPATPPITKTPDKLAAFLDSAPNPMHSQTTLLDLSSEVTETESKATEMQFAYNEQSVPTVETTLLNLTEVTSVVSENEENLFKPFAHNAEKIEEIVSVEGNVWNNPTENLQPDINVTESAFEYTEKANEPEAQPDLASLEPVTVETIPETTPVAEDVVDDESEDGDGWRYYSANPSEDPKKSAEGKEEKVLENLDGELKVDAPVNEPEKPKDNVLEATPNENLIPDLLSDGNEMISDFIAEPNKDKTLTQESVLNLPNEDKTVCMEISDNKNIENRSVSEVEFSQDLLAHKDNEEEINDSISQSSLQVISQLDLESSTNISTSTPLKYLSSDELREAAEKLSFTETPENSFSVSLSQDLNVEVVQEKTSFVSVSYETTEVPKEFIISEDAPEMTNPDAVLDVVISEVTPVTNASAEATQNLGEGDAKANVEPVSKKPEEKAEVKPKPAGKQPPAKKPLPGTKSSQAPKSKTVTETSTLKSKPLASKAPLTKSQDKKPVPKAGVPATNSKLNTSARPTTAKLKPDSASEVTKSGAGAASTSRRNVVPSTRPTAKKEGPGASKDPLAKKPTSATTMKTMSRPSSAPTRSTASKSLERKPLSSNVTERKQLGTNAAEKKPSSSNVTDRKPPISSVTERKPLQLRASNKTATSGSARPTTSEISKTKQTKDTLNKTLSTTVKQISRTTTVSRTAKQSSKEGSGPLVKTSTSTVTKSSASISRETSCPTANKSSIMPKSSSPKTGTVKKSLNSQSNLKSTQKSPTPTNRSPLTKDKVVTKSPAKQVNKPVTNSEKGALDEKTKELCPMNGDANVEGPADHAVGDVVINGFSGAASPISSDTVEQGSGDVAPLLTEPSANNKNMPIANSRGTGR